MHLQKVTVTQPVSCLGLMFTTIFADVVCSTDAIAVCVNPRPIPLFWSLTAQLRLSFAD